MSNKITVVEAFALMQKGQVAKTELHKYRIRGGELQYFGEHSEEWRKSEVSAIALIKASWYSAAQEYSFDEALVKMKNGATMLNDRKKYRWKDDRLEFHEAGGWWGNSTRTFNNLYKSVWTEA